MLYIDVELKGRGYRGMINCLSSDIIENFVESQIEWGFRICDDMEILNFLTEVSCASKIWELGEFRMLWLETYSSLDISWSIVFL